MSFGLGGLAGLALAPLANVSAGQGMAATSMGIWALWPPHREQRPNIFREGTDRCPFCAGHEADTPPEIWRDGTPWRVRVFPNKYPATEEHEVIVETPDHRASFDQLTPDHAAAGQPNGPSRPTGHLHGKRIGHTGAGIPVAAQPGRHPWRHQRHVHDWIDEPGGQRRALPGDCLTSDAPTVFFCTKQSASSMCQGSSLPRTPPNTADDRA